MREAFMSLVQQVAYLDHVHNTNFAVELAETISHAKAEGLKPNEIMEGARSRVAGMKIKDDEQRQALKEFLDQLLIIL